MRLYLGIVAGTIILAFAAMMTLSAAGIYSCFDCDILRYQESKIDKLSDVDTVFLGDSSLGFALDAGTFSELSGRKTVNLALLGYNYGFGGAYALLEEILKRAHPNNVIIALTPQTYALTIDQLQGLPIRGFLQASRHHPRQLFSIDRSVSKEVVKILTQELFDREFLVAGVDFLRGRLPQPLPAYFWQFDYLHPSNDVLDISTVIESWGANVTHDYDAFISKTATICREHRLNCLYMHSTLLGLVIERNRAFIQQLGDRIERSGIKVPYPLPVAIPASDIGNTINHVRPDLRLVYTRKFYDLLAPLLR